jgi:hypothetical protein
VIKVDNGIFVLASQQSSRKDKDQKLGIYKLSIDDLLKNDDNNQILNEQLTDDIQLNQIKMEIVIDKNVNN